MRFITRITRFSDIFPNEEVHYRPVFHRRNFKYNRIGGDYLKDTFNFCMAWFLKNAISPSPIQLIS